MSRSTAKYKYRKYAQDSGLVLKAARWQDYTKEDLAEFGMYLDHVLSEREVPVAQRVFSRQTIAYALEARILLTKMEDPYGLQWFLYTKPQSSQFTIDEQGRTSKLIAELIEIWKETSVFMGVNGILKIFRDLGVDLAEMPQIATSKEIFASFVKASGVIEIARQLVAEESYWDELVEKKGKVNWPISNIKAHLGIEEAAYRYDMPRDKVLNIIKASSKGKTLVDLTFRELITQRQFSKVPEELRRLRYNAKMCILDTELLNSLGTVIDFAIFHWVWFPDGEYKNFDVAHQRHDELQEAYEILGPKVDTEGSQPMPF